MKYPINATFGLSSEQDAFLTRVCELTRSSRADTLRQIFDDYRSRHHPWMTTTEPAWRDIHGKFRADP